MPEVGSQIDVPHPSSNARPVNARRASNATQVAGDRAMAAHGLARAGGRDPAGSIIPGVGPSRGGRLGRVLRNAGNARDLAGVNPGSASARGRP